ncbi:MAG: TetR family transcriptional regulator [Gemmatimonadota bacterium]|nr:TetR family transcriptional regulator [Gemmatimonadota bacterium]
MVRSDPETRQRIARAALEEFAEFGFHGGRTDRIAKRAEANKQLLYYYFGSKAKLYEAVLQNAATRLGSAEGAGSAQKHPIEQVRLRLRTVLDALASHPRETRLLIRGIQDSGDQGAAAKKAVGQLLIQIKTDISKGQGLGYVRDDVDPARVAEHAVVLVLGHLSLVPVLERESDAASRTGAIQTALEALLKTLAW